MSCQCFYRLGAQPCVAPLSARLAIHASFRRRGRMASKHDGSSKSVAHGCSCIVVAVRRASLRTTSSTRSGRQPQRLGHGLVDGEWVLSAETSVTLGVPLGVMCHAQSEIEDLMTTRALVCLDFGNNWGASFVGCRGVRNFTRSLRLPVSI